MKFSIRMRSAKGGAHENGGIHISGAERIVAKENLEEFTQQLVSRALNHSKGSADFIRITIDAIDENTIVKVPMLKVKSSQVEDYTAGRNLACTLLGQYGVSPLAAHKAVEALVNLKDNYRGALLFHKDTGARLDLTGNRGVRVTHMDYNDPNTTKKKLQALGYSNVHFQEALVLASKVLSTPGIVAELCWSDDPDYVTGYVSGLGEYHRISHMKPLGSPLGGRIFFVDPTQITNLDELINYLEKQVVLVE